ncbi:MAG: hypothetical protein ABSD89_15025 [Halobacteriota archaeon]|jgi:hypothetical protein
MIKIDVSNAIPKRLGTYLLGIIPGLLFELSIAFGDPRLARLMIDRAEQIYAFKPYALLILFVVSSLVVGQTFFLLSWFAGLLINSVYGFKRYFIRVTFGSDWLYRTFGKLQGIPPKRNVFIRSLSRMVTWGRKKRFPFEIRPVLKCQRLAATQLLVRRYGINPSKGPGDWVDLEWQVWLLVLGKQPPVFREALLMMRTFLGCGLAEISALYICPALRNRYFVATSVVFITAGCFQSLDFAKRSYEPVRSSLTRLVFLLAELAETNTATKKEENSPDKGPNLAISTDANEDG